MQPMCSLRAAFVALLPLLAAHDLMACTHRHRKIPTQPVKIVFTQPNLALIRIGNYLTFGSPRGSTCACGLSTLPGGAILQVLSAQVVQAGTNKQVAFLWVLNRTTSAAWNRASPGNWTGFLSRPTSSPVPKDVPVDLVFAVSVRSGTTLGQLYREFSDPRTKVGTDEGRPDGTLTGRHRLILHLSPGTELFGTGCPQAKPLTLGFTGAALAGKTLNLHLSNGPAAGSGAVFLGALRTKMDLSRFGMPGCTLYVSLFPFVADVPVVFGGGGALRPLPIPSNAPHGATFVTQGFAVDLFANRITASNGGEVTVAAK